MRSEISVIIPVRNGTATLGRCLASLAESDTPALECLVVDDGSTDDSAAIARSFGAVVISLGEGSGAGAARNMGALYAKGEILLFLDSDVCVRPETVRKIEEHFRGGLVDAVIGSYDFSPAEKNFCSQYRNLMHAFTHQTARTQAQTFWTGCGAVKQDAFLRAGGFDENYCSIEDVEFGRRLARAGYRIRLDHELLVNHLKRWNFLPMIKTDVIRRGIPWTRLILSEGRMPDDMNLKWSQRWSIFAAWVAVVSVACIGIANLIWIGAIAISAIGLLLICNWSFYSFLTRERGLRFAAAAFPLHFCFHALNAVAFAAGVCAFFLERNVREDRGTEVVRYGRAEADPEIKGIL